MPLRVAQLPPPMYPNLPRTRHEYELIHGVDRIDAWIEKWQSDVYLEEFNARGDNLLDFAGELYPQYVLVILRRCYIVPSSNQHATMVEPLLPNLRATLSMRIGVSHRAYSFKSHESSISPEVQLAQYESNSGWLFDEVSAPKWVTMQEFQDEIFLLELPREKVYALMTQAVCEPVNSQYRGLASRVNKYLDILQMEHPEDEAARYPPPPAILPRARPATFPRAKRVLPASWKKEGQTSASAPVVANRAARPQSLPPSYRAPVTHGMTTRSHSELYILRLRNRSLRGIQHQSIPY